MEIDVATDDAYFEANVTISCSRHEESIEERSGGDIRGWDGDGMDDVDLDLEELK